MGLLIDIVDETNSVSADALQEVEKLLQFAAEKEGVQDQAEVSVTIVTNEEIREINRDYQEKTLRLTSFHLRLKKKAKTRLKS